MKYLHTTYRAVAGGSKRVASYLQLAISEFLDDNGSHLSASMSYYLLLSLVPMLLALMSILGFLLPTYPWMGDAVKDWFYNFIPSDETINVMNTALDNIRDLATTSGIIAVTVMLWGGTSIFNVIRKTLNIIWGITIPRPFFRERLMEVIMVAVVGSLMLVSLLLTIWVRIVSDASELTGFAATINNDILKYLFPGAIMFLVFMFLYRFAPYVKLRWKDVWVEALVVAVVFEVIKNIFVLYVANFNVDNFLGSALGFVLATLIWAYVSSIAFLFGAEVASLRFRGVTIWGRGPIEVQEGPIPTFIEELKANNQMPEDEELV